MEYYRFEVRLLDVKPPPWRQFLIRKAAMFERLHMAIQDACGWTNTHLYAFHATDDGPVIAGIPDDAYSSPDPDAKRVKLSSFFTPGGPARCFYHYDFGDDWWHEVVLHGHVTMPDKFTRHLMGGARAFPPEDCGGSSGYENCCKATQHEDDGLDDPDGLRQWLGRWKPETFDLKKLQADFDR